MYSGITCFTVLCAVVAASGFTITDTNVIFHLYTRNNPVVSQPLLPAIASIMFSSLSLTRRTVFTIHSHDDTVSGNFNAFVVQAELATEDVNVIAVDWSAGAGMYTVGLTNAPAAGLIIAGFIGILTNNFSYNPGLIRIVGVGLGGHIAGIAARTVGNIPHVVALDPSFHGWTHHPDILSPNDATVVEVLHTTSGILGYDFPLGDIDFYPNGGSFQNGCGTQASCSHIYAYAFYAESLTTEVTNGDRFVGTKCESYEQAIQLACSGDRDVAFGGLTNKAGSSGIYMFTTNFAQPFARG